MRKRIPLLVILLLMLLFAVGVAFAQGGSPGTVTDDEVNAIAKQLYCPVCENVPLDVCGTQACAQWRELIREKLGDGWTEDQIKQYFAAQYGDRVLAAPPARGLNWMVYIIPPLAILAGVYFLIRAFKSWYTPAEKEPSTITEPQPDDEYIAKLEDELSKR